MKKNDYSLSVIVPVYNAESTLQSCLDSILNQSYRNFELILVDDGSTDNSLALCNMYAQTDNRITVFHIENSGAFQARKYGAEKAFGEILTFSDADDWLEGNAFETIMPLFYNYNLDILAYTYVNDEGKTEKHLYKEGLYSKEEIGDKIIPGMMYDSDCGGRRLNPSLCCKMIKRDLFKRVAASVKDRVTFGDDALITYPAVCLAERIFICNKALYHYRVNPVSCTHTYPLERITEVKAFQDNMVRLFDEMGMLFQTKYQIENYVRSFLAMMIRSWYGIELSSVLFTFPYNLVPKGIKILIYGAGNVGKSYVNELKLTRYAMITGWADKNHESIRGYHGVKIIAPEQIKEKEFDMLLIAVGDEKRAKTIAADLLDLGVPQGKMVWVKPMHII